MLTLPARSPYQSEATGKGSLEVPFLVRRVISSQFSLRSSP